MPTVRLIFNKGLHHDMMACKRYGPARPGLAASPCGCLRTPRRSCQHRGFISLKAAELLCASRSPSERNARRGADTCMISSHHAVDVGTACFKPTTRSSLHSTIRSSCQIRQNSSIGLVAACLYVRPALPAAFYFRRKLSAARPICPECPSTAHKVIATQQEHASTSTKVQRKRQRPLFSYCCNSQQAPGK